MDIGFEPGDKLGPDDGLGSGDECQTRYTTHRVRMIFDDEPGPDDETWIRCWDMDPAMGLGSGDGP